MSVVSLVCYSAVAKDNFKVITEAARLIRDDPIESGVDVEIFSHQW